MKSFQLSDGTEHPCMGFGTYKVGVIPPMASGQNGVKGYTGKDIKQVVASAVEAGYKMFDCAAFYENEKEIGEALAASGQADGLYVCSKVWTATVCKGRDAVLADVRRMAADLQRPALDLCLIHWPAPGKHVAAYLALQEAKKLNLVKSIGISNYTIEDYQELMACPEVTEKPVVNQIEVNPLLYRKKTIDFFQSEGVLIEAYRPLGAGKALSLDCVRRIAERRSASPANVICAWLLSLNIVPLVKSETPARIVDNLKALDLKLTDEDLTELSSVTSPDAIKSNVETYKKNVVRDTPWEGTTEGVKTEVTAG
ncbi:hypothetical protein DIPPA_23620 [Diplonema papillatum]|nr:hypothetical protein DIPPA_23620 [Diplonema papillatum]